MQRSNNDQIQHVSHWHVVVRLDNPVYKQRVDSEVAKVRLLDRPGDGS